MRNNLKAWALCAALACALVGGAAAETAPDVLTVDQAVAAALRNNLAVKSASADARIKKRASDFSFNKFYPSVSTTATALRLNQVSPVLVGSSATQASDLTAGEVLPNAGTFYYGIDKTNLALGLTIQEVFSPSYLLLMNQAAIDYQGSLIDKAKAEKSMTAAVKKFFYQLLVQKEAIALTKSRLDNANERLRQAQITYEVGQGTELNYMYAKANVEGLIPDLRSMESSRVSALTQFQEILGFDRREDMELSGSLDDEKIASGDDAKVSGARFDVQEAQQTVKQLECALRLQDSTLLPNLIVQYSADPALNDPSSWSKVLNSDNWSQSSGGLSLTLSWSLSAFLPGSDYNVKRQELQDRLALARENAQTIARNAGHDEDTQLRAIRDSLAKIENLRNVAQASQRAYELTDASYKSGAGRFLDLQAAEISSQGAQIQLLNERLNLMSLLYDLEAKYDGGR